MPSIIRKNIAVCTVTFTAEDGTLTQPSAAFLVLNYKDQTGSPKQVSLPMTQNVGLNSWTADWDTSASGMGTVYWMVYGQGPLQAADQGSFEVRANEANNV